MRIQHSIDEELRFHIDRLTAMLINEGMSPAEAAHEASQRFGDVGRYRAQCERLQQTQITRGRRWEFAHSVRKDLRYALRSLGRAPVFTIVTVVTLALGIGANTAIFSVVNGVLLRPLGFLEPERLGVLLDTSPALGVASSPTSVNMFHEWRAQNREFASLAAWFYASVTLEDPTESAELTGVLVTGNYFRTLGIEPLRGRLLHVDDEVAGRRGPVAVISSGLWHNRFGADPDVVGRTATFDGQPLTIVGVIDSKRSAPSTEGDVWIPYGFPPTDPPNYGMRSIHVVGRLAEGSTIGQARGDIAAIAERIADAYPVMARGWSATVIPMRDRIVGDVRTPLLVALAAVAILLVIACVNIANLLLARAASRDREIAVRTALGAGRGRIARQLLTESLVLAGLGATIGVLVAYALHGILIALEPGILPRLEEVRLDLTVLGFGIGLALLTGLLFGMAPTLHSMRVDLSAVLKQGRARAGNAGDSHNRLRAALVTAQTALTLVLLIGAGLLGRTFLELRRIDPGFQAEGVVAARIFLDARRYQGTNVNLYYRTLLDSIQSLPGVTTVGASSSLPMDAVAINYDLPFRTEATAGQATGELPQADFRIVTPGYFEAIQVPVISGRLFTMRDDGTGPGVIIVNRTMAELQWPDEDPVGRRLQTVGTRGWAWFEIIGVVEDTRYYGLASDPRPEMYVPLDQYPFSSMTIVARTSLVAGSAAAMLRRTILEQDANQPAHTILPVQELIAESIASEKFYATLLGCFAIVALALAAAGIYGVLSYWVSQRTQEIGVRMALGARRQQVVRLVVGNGMGVTALGMVFGLLAAFALARLLATMLFGVGTADPLTFVGVPMVLGGAAFLACYVPARRAGRVDPMTALRDE